MNPRSSFMATSSAAINILSTAARARGRTSENDEGRARRPALAVGTDVAIDYQLVPVQPAPVLFAVHVRMYVPAAVRSILNVFVDFERPWTS